MYGPKKLPLTRSIHPSSPPPLLLGRRALSLIGPRSNGLLAWGHHRLPTGAIVAVSTRAELGTFGDMTNWGTYAEAAEILGCHVSNVSRLVAKGLLSSTGQRGASFDRDSVEELARRRQARREMLEQRTRKYQRIDHRPDHEHEWLSPREVAELLGVTPQSVTRRIRHEQLPGVEHGGRRWIRRDHLEQVEAARLARKTRRLSARRVKTRSHTPLSAARAVPFRVARTGSIVS